MNAELTVIGASATAPTYLGPASGYLLTTPRGSILIDCGSGVIGGLAKDRRLDEVDALLVSHSHADHSADLPVLAYRRSFPQVLPSLPLYAPEDLVSRLPKLDDVYGIPTLDTMKTPLGSRFEMKVREPGEGFEVVGHRVQTILADHPVPTMSIKFPDYGFVYTADTGLTDELVEFSRGASLLLAECTYRAADNIDVTGHGHLDGHTVGQLAREAGVKHLAVTHVADPDHIPDIEAEVREVFDGKVTMCAPGDRFPLGSFS